MTNYYANTKLPTSALVNLSIPDRTPVDATPVICDGSVCLVPMMADGQPILMTPNEIVTLGGTVPRTGDMLVAEQGRKFIIGGQHYTLGTIGDGRWILTEC